MLKFMAWQTASAYTAECTCMARDDGHMHVAPYEKARNNCICIWVWQPTNDDINNLLIFFPQRRSVTRLVICCSRVYTAQCHRRRHLHWLFNMYFHFDMAFHLALLCFIRHYFYVDSTLLTNTPHHAMASATAILFSNTFSARHFVSFRLSSCQTATNGKLFMLQQTQAKNAFPQHQQQEKTKTKFKVNSKQRQLLHLIIKSRLHDISLFRWNAISWACGSCSATKTAALWTGRRKQVRTELEFDVPRHNIPRPSPSSTHTLCSHARRSDLLVFLWREAVSGQKLIK